MGYEEEAWVLVEGGRARITIEEAGEQGYGTYGRRMVNTSHASKSDLTSALASLASFTCGSVSFVASMQLYTHACRAIVLYLKPLS